MSSATHTQHTYGVRQRNVRGEAQALKEAGGDRMIPCAMIQQSDGAEEAGKLQK